MANKDSVYISITEAAEIIGCTNETVVNLLTRGVLRGNDTAIQRRTYVDRESVKTFCTAVPNYQDQVEHIDALVQELDEKEAELEDMLLRYDIVLSKQWLQTTDEFLKSVSGWLLNERDANILNDALCGYPLAKLAAKYDLSRERCRQVINHAARRLHNRISYKAICDCLRLYHGRPDVAEKAYNEPERKYIDLSWAKNDKELTKADLSTRTLNLLHSCRIFTIGDLLSTPMYRLNEIKSFGFKSYREVEMFVKSQGLDIYEKWINLRLDY